MWFSSSKISPEGSADLHSSLDPGKSCHQHTPALCYEAPGSQPNPDRVRARKIYDGENVAQLSSMELSTQYSRIYTWILSHGAPSPSCSKSENQKPEPRETLVQAWNAGERGLKLQFCFFSSSWKLEGFPVLPGNFKFSSSGPLKSNNVFVSSPWMEAFWSIWIFLLGANWATAEYRPVVLRQGTRTWESWGERRDHLQSRVHTPECHFRHFGDNKFLR